MEKNLTSIVDLVWEIEEKEDEKVGISPNSTPIVMFMSCGGATGGCSCIPDDRRP